MGPDFRLWQRKRGKKPRARSIHLQLEKFQNYLKMSEDSQMMGHMPKRLIGLTVAGFDPGSGAGITADLKTFAAHGIYGVACITALTVQSTLGVRAVEPVSPALVRQTLECLIEDISPGGIKIGMLGNSAVAGAVSSFLDAQAFPRRAIVLDPVLRSSSGAALIDPPGVELIRQKLLRQVGWITPNLEELAILAGPDSSSPGNLSREEVPAAAAQLREMAAQLGNHELNVVVTGGHLSRPDDFLLTSAGEGSWVEGERVDTKATHGTGCAFSTALLSALISGKPPARAPFLAKSYVAEALRSAYPIGQGKGPMNHLFSFR
jgi:hydroxymethylpyrimidine/phosphomethylpyrimidine kinase